MYVKRNNKAHCVTIVTAEKQGILHVLSASVALRTQHAMRMRQNVICGLSGSKIFFHITS
jgi:hypothetical protein